MELSPGTWAGVSEAVVVPLPNWPEVLSPHAQTAPSTSRASAKFSPSRD